MWMKFVIIPYLLILASCVAVTAFIGSSISRPQKAFGIRPQFGSAFIVDLSTTTVAPPKTDTDRATRDRRRNRRQEGAEDNDYDEAYIRRNGPLEYLEDDTEESREDQDPFHILLLAETYLNRKITVNYVSGALQFVLDMPYEDSVDAAIFAKENGMSCLGTWTREECLALGKDLQQRDLCVRVVPFVPGGQRPWQANKDASSDNGGASRRSDGNNRELGGSGGGGSIIDVDFS
jgi:hypothetical protein